MYYKDFMTKNILKYLLGIFILFTISNCAAQSGIRLGLKGGIGIPDLKASGDNPVSSGWSSRLGPYIGAVAEIQLNERLYLQGELNYASQGGKKNGVQAIATSELSAYITPGQELPPYIYANFKSEVRINYLELPILVKINFSVEKSFSFFVNGGIYAGYLLTAKNVTGGSSNVYLDEKLTQPLTPAAISFDQSTEIKDNIKKFNFGLQGGIGISYDLPNKNRLLLTVGGNYGLIHLQKNEDNGKNNTGAATITLSYLIHF